MTVYPQSYLPPKSQPWGRSIESELLKNREALRLNALDTSNNLRQLNSSVDLISRQQSELEEQQDYLSSFLTYTTLDPSYLFTTSVSFGTVIKTTYLNFTLSRDSIVLITTDAFLTASADKNAGTFTNPSVSIFNRFFVDNDGGYFTNDLVGYVLSSNTGYANVTRHSNITRSAVVEILAGSHTIKSEWGVVLNGNTGYGSAEGASIVASVIG